MPTTARFLGLLLVGRSRRLALALLCLAALSTGLSGCGAGSEALPSDLPAPTGGRALIISTTTMEDGVFMRPYSETLSTTGGTPPLVGCAFAAGTPPPGLAVNPNPSNSTCVVSGVPTQAGLFTFTVRAQDSNNVTDTQDYTVAIRDEFILTTPGPDPLPDGVEDLAYSPVVFTVQTDTVIGPDDFGEAAENGNGPLTQCGVAGLPAGMAAVGGSITTNSCQITISGTPNIGLGPTDAPVTFPLTLEVRDTGIAGSNTPRGLVTQTIDLTIQPPIGITLITSDPGSTAGCMGGTFDDSTSGMVLPDAVTGRPYGDPSCDLLFAVTGGLAPYTWSDNSLSPLTPFVCAEEGTDNEFFRCNSAGVTDAGGTMAEVIVSVMDAVGTTVSTDVFGHARHTIFVNNEIVIDNLFLTNGVVDQPYTQTLTCDAGTGSCGGTGDPNNAAAQYTWSETGGPAHADIMVDPPPVGQPGDGTYLGTPTTAGTDLMPEITVTDDGNDTTPACSAVTPMPTCPTFIPTYHIFAPTAIVDAAQARVQFYTTDTGAPVFDSSVDLDAMSTPVRAAFSPNGTIIVVADDGEGEVSLINLADGTVTQVNTSGGAGNARGIAIGPKTSPLANPDSWMAYIANPTDGTGGVRLVDIEPGSFASGAIFSIPGAKDVAITPTFAGPETRVYVLSGTDDVCAIVADPGPSLGLRIDFDPSTPLVVDCLSTSGQAGDTVHIEIANGRAFVTKSTGILLAIDIVPGSMTRDTVVDTEDLSVMAVGCTAPGDLRANPAGTQIWVACGAANQVTIVDSSTLSVLGSVATGMNTNPQDIAFNIDGSLALVTLFGTHEVLPIDTSGPPAPGTAESTDRPGMNDDVTNPEGIDHIRDPQLNALISVNFPIQAPPESNPRAGRELSMTVAVSGGVQPYTLSLVETSGTACEGLSLNAVTGRISGTPVNTGTCSLTIEVRDSTPGAPQSRRVTKTITVE
jgi:hypothetical protein